jgi:acetate kinase
LLARKLQTGESYGKSGAYLALLGRVDALIFGGGIGENSVFVWQYVCDGLHGFGIEMDAKANERIIDVEGRLSLSNSETEILGDARRRRATNGARMLSYLSTIAFMLAI